VTDKAAECSVTFPAGGANNTLKSVEYANTLEDAVDLTIKLSGLNYEPSGGTCGTHELATNGTYEGAALLTQVGEGVLLLLHPLEVRGGTAKPEFKVLPSVRTVTGSGATAKVTAGSDTVECADSASTGEIISMTQIGKLVIKFKGCVVKNTSTKSTCTIKSTGAANGELVSHTLKGELGTTKSTEAASEVGLLLEPETTKKWMTLAETSCTPESTLSGSLAGEASPASIRQAIDSLYFAAESGKQIIKDITVSSGQKTPELEVFSSKATVEASEQLEYTGEVEVL
jgi:hypothetical protein